MQSRFPSADPHRFRGKRLLVIDGSEAQLDLTAQLMATQGFEVLQLRAGKFEPREAMPGRPVARSFSTPEQLERYLRTLNFDAVLTGGKLLEDTTEIDFEKGAFPEDFTGIDATPIIQRVKPQAPVVVGSIYYDKQFYSDAAENAERDGAKLKAAGGSAVCAKGDYIGICDALEAAFAAQQRGK